MTYRPDIDGLRAIAVLSVVAFHLGLSGFDGGYVGVDAFFVISGYLITGIISRDIEQGRFSLRQFYFRRIRRLVPAVIATVASTTLVAGWIMTPYDLIAYGRSAVAALFSLSNIVFFIESGYWDTASELKPLLHTWSLAVEEQFYLFWPALVMGLLAIRALVPFTLSLAVIFFGGAALCIWYSYVDGSAAFYLLPFRVFQFALGALAIPLSAVLSQSSRHALLGGVCFWSGLLLVAISVYALGEGVLFPGWVILLPTVGAALMLMAGAQPAGLAGTAASLMQNRVSRWFGKVSYSLYLVHWPIIALYRYQFGMELSPSDQLLLAAAMVPATLMLHYGVEYRFYSRSGATTSHDGQSVPPARFALRIGLVATLVALAPLSAWRGDGWTWRYPELVLTPEQIEQGKLDRFLFFETACPVHRPQDRERCKPDAPYQVHVFGNSHEPDGYNFLRGALEGDERFNVSMFGTINRCDDLEVVGGQFISSFDNCQFRLNWLRNPAFFDNLDMVFYAANRPFAPNKKATLDILRTLRAEKPELKIVILGGYINTKVDCSRYIEETGSTDPCALPENVVYFAGTPEDQLYYKEFMALADLYIDRIDLLCKNRVLQTCLTRTADGTPAFYDIHHHSREFAEMTGRLYRSRHPDQLESVLNSSESAGTSTADAE